MWNKVSRILLLLLLYSAVLVGSFYLAFHLRFEFYPGPYMERFKLGILLPGDHPAAALVFRAVPFPALLLRTA